MIELAQSGVSRNQIGKRLGRSADTVGRICAEAGIEFDRSKTAVAVAAKQMDNAAKRALLQAKLLDDALAIREALWRPATVFNFGGRDNTYAEHTLERPDFNGQNAIMRTVSVAVNSAAKLAEQDRTAGDPTAAVSLLGDLVDGMREKYGTGEESTDDAESPGSE